MKDLGLVHVHGKGCDIGGPVAILLESDDHTHFLGAYIEDNKGEKLVLTLIPKNAISDNIGWQRSAPYSERLLRHVATLDAVAGKGWGNTEAAPVSTEEPEQPASRKPPTRVFSRHGVVPLKEKLVLPPIPTSKKPAPATTTSPEVLAVKADLENVMGKYKQIVKDDKK